MAKKKYSELNSLEKRRYSETWVDILDKHCPADEIGNRPCDNGCPCDRCHYDEVIQSEFKAELKVLGIEIED